MAIVYEGKLTVQEFDAELAYPGKGRPFVSVHDMCGEVARFYSHLRSERVLKQVWNVAQAWVAAVNASRGLCDNEE